MDPSKTSQTPRFTGHKFTIVTQEATSQRCRFWSHICACPNACAINTISAIIDSKKSPKKPGIGSPTVYSSNTQQQGTKSTSECNTWRRKHSVNYKSQYGRCKYFCETTEAEYRWPFYFDEKHEIFTTYTET